MKKLLGRMMMVTTVLAGLAMGKEALPTGAAPAWTSDDPVTVEARGLVREGKFKEAAALIQKNADANVPERAELIELMRRIRRDYPMNLDQFLERLQQTMPDATRADVLDWGDFTAPASVLSSSPAAASLATRKNGWKILSRSLSGTPFP